MEILGLGGWEIGVILIIMLVVAGPKRMIAWSYTLGKYVAQLRALWSDAAKQIQTEFDQAGVDIQVPKDLPTRGNVSKEISRMVTSASKPIKDQLDIDGMKNDLKEVQDTTRDAGLPMQLGKPNNIKPIGRPASPKQPPITFPTGAAKTPAASNGTAPTPSADAPANDGFGTWSSGE